MTHTTRRFLHILACLALLLAGLISATTTTPSSPVFAASWTPPESGSDIYPWTDIPLGAGLDLNAANAGLTLSLPLFDLPGVNGFDEGLSLVYNSQSSSIDEPAGNGWLLAPADMGLSIGGSSITLYDASGAAYTFTGSACRHTSPAGIDATLACSYPGYTLTDNVSGAVDTFNGAGFLVGLQNRSGNTITFTRDTNNLVTSITNTEGQTTTFGYTGGQVTTITEPNGEVWTLGYNGQNDLVSITDPQNDQTQLSYTLQTLGGTTYHQLTTLTDPDGNPTTFAYSQYQPGQLSSVTNPLGKATAVSLGTNQVTVTDANNHATTYALDSKGRIEKATYPDGTSSSQEWNGDNQITSVTSPGGNTTSFSYGSNNMLQGITLPTGATESWGYYSSTFPYLPTTYTDAQGNETRYAYSTQGLLATVTDPSGKTQSYTYNGNGTLATATDENGHQTSYSYFSDGLLQQETPPSPLGSTSMTYNADDQESSVTDGNGKLTSFTYDKTDALTGIGFADGSAIGYSYDPAGNLLGMTDSTGDTEYHYDAAGELISEVLPRTPTSCTDSAGNPASICYAYDPVGNLLSKTDSAGTTSYGYNELDELTAVTDRGGEVYTLGYSKDGEETSIGFPNGMTESMGYNGAGQLTSIGATGKYDATLTAYTYGYTQPRTNKATDLPYSETYVAPHNQNESVTFGYDSSNELTGETNGNNSYAYTSDPAGNLTGATVNTWPDKSTFTYNAADELTSSSGAINRTFSYDDNGDRTSSSDGTSITLNDAGQITSITPPNSSSIPYTYTGVGETERIGNGSTSYQWDGSGISQQTDSSGTTAFTTTPDGQLLAETIPSDSNAGTYFYLSDGMGNVAALVNSAESIVDSYSYDPLGNATSSGNVPNPFTFQGWQFDSQTGYYYTGSGYYDPATGQSFGCHDKGPVDPGEDLCGEDEPGWCQGVCNDKNPYYAELTSGQASLRSGQVGLFADDAGGEGVFGGGGEGGGGGGGGDEEGGGVQSAPAAIPEQAKFVYEYVLSHDFQAPPGYEGGGKFENRDDDLPPGNYKEYDIYRFTSKAERGLKRIVVNVDNGKGYYTSDHYRSFIRIP